MFQPEIRSALEQIGRGRISGKSFSVFPSIKKSNAWLIKQENAISTVADVAETFSNEKTGALIVLERETKLSDIAVSGTVLDSELSYAILANVFYNKAPLHDGACIIRDGRLYAAGCILPLTVNNNVNAKLGTRHRAALGMSENSDAVVLVVSEETGTISLAVKGSLISGLEKEEVITKLTKLLIPSDEEKKSFWSSLFFRKKEDKNNEEA